MKKMIQIFLMISLPLFAQDITNKLGGNTANETYDITDSANEVLLRVQGDGKVGIGTELPDANLDIHGTLQVFGSYETKFFGTVFQATTDGFVVAYGYESFAGSSTASVTGHTSSTDNTLLFMDTVVAWDYNSDDDEPVAASIMFPVRKADYWKVSLGGGSVFNKLSWIPLG